MLLSAAAPADDVSTKQSRGEGTCLWIKDHHQFSWPFVHEISPLAHGRGNKCTEVDKGEGLALICLDKMLPHGLRFKFVPFTYQPPPFARSFRFSRICRFYLHSSPGLGFSLGFRRRNKWLWLPVWWTRVSDGFVIKRNFHFKVPGTVINLLDRPFYNLEYNLLDCNGF